MAESPRYTKFTFGPQHPVFPEPIQFKLDIVDERVVGATPEIGYIHRGIEKAYELNDFKTNVQLAEKICGICPAPHTTAYVNGVESLMGIEAPPRAQYIRVVTSEFNRLHSHLMWFGLMGDALGFESYFMQMWNYREELMDHIERFTGHRIYYSMNAIGGLRRDVDDSIFRETEKVMSSLEGHFEEISGVMNDYAFRKRQQGVGVLTAAEARETGAVGPILKATGAAYDIRSEGYNAYRDLKFKPVTADSCDVYGRTVVRWREMRQSIDLIRQCINAMPKGEAVSRVEAPRGEVFYYIKGNGTLNLDRVKIRTPTFANIWPTVVMLTKGCQLADVPAIVLSMDPCISCAER